MSWKLKFDNDTGTYYCDESGLLLTIEPREDNCLYRGPFGPHRLDMERRGLIYYKAYRVRDLVIPEGVRILGNGDPDSFSLDGTFQDSIIVGCGFPPPWRACGTMSCPAALSWTWSCRKRCGISAAGPS